MVESRVPAAAGWQLAQFRQRRPRWAPLPFSKRTRPPGRPPKEWRPLRRPSTLAPRSVPSLGTLDLPGNQGETDTGGGRRVTGGVQLSALIGVIVGAVASYVVTALAERTRWKRQTAARWDERRLVAYADYSQAVKTIVTLAHRLAAFRGLSPDAKPLSHTEDNLALLQQAEEQRSSCLEGVRLLTDSDTSRRSGG